MFAFSSVFGVFLRMIVMGLVVMVFTSPVSGFYKLFRGVGKSTKNLKDNGKHGLVNLPGPKLKIPKPSLGGLNYRGRDRGLSGVGAGFTGGNTVNYNDGLLPNSYISDDVEIEEIPVTQDSRVSNPAMRRVVSNPTGKQIISNPTQADPGRQTVVVKETTYYEPPREGNFSLRRREMKWNSDDEEE